MTERRYGQEQAPLVMRPDPQDCPVRAPKAPPVSGEVLEYKARIGRWAIVRIGEVRVKDRRRVQ